MIKKIHYVWLGGKLPPPNVKYCIKSWIKHCPDFEIIEWNENNFDIEKHPWAREAIANKKYAFASDFIRLYVLEQHGGIYVDTDVEFLKSPEAVIRAKFVSGIENFHYGTHDLDNVDENGIDKGTGKTVEGFGVNAGFIYTEPHSPVIQYILENVYNGGKRHFMNDDGSTNQMIIDGVLMQALNKKYGLKYRDVTQKLDNDILIFNSEIISTKQSLSPASVIVHWYDQTWNAKNTFAGKAKNAIKKNHPWLYRQLYYLSKMVSVHKL